MTACDHPGCGRDVDDHTLRELRAHHPAENLNLPYQDAPGDPIAVPLDTQGVMAGAIVVRGLVMPVPDGPQLGLPRAIPALGFTFFGADGLHEVAKVVLVLTDDGMRNVRSIVGGAIDSSLKATRRAR